MKRLWVEVFLAFLIILGISFLVFVLRMMWFPPSMMGMMMGKQMMYQHMLFMFKQTFWISIFLTGVILFILVISDKKK